VNSKIEPLNSQYRNKFQTNKLAERFLAPQISFEIIISPPILILNNLSSGSFLNNFINNKYYYYNLVIQCTLAIYVELILLQRTL